MAAPLFAAAGIVVIALGVAGIRAGFYQERLTRWTIPLVSGMIMENT
jgi:DNA-binding IclR family transcriptional regulator